MTVSATRKLQEIAEQSGSDPRGALLNAIGDSLDGINVFHNNVLIATYVRPEKTKSGIILGGDKTRAEDRFQSKCGLVIQVGPIAFKDDAVNKFGGKTVDAGDWVLFRTSDAFEFFAVDDNGRDGVSVRLIADTNIMGTTDDPEKVF
jgi:co-chaperonin GroES (HSP10)